LVLVIVSDAAALGSPLVVEAQPDSTTASAAAIAAAREILRFIRQLPLVCCCLRSQRQTVF
jgi:hypothetical protein